MKPHLEATWFAYDAGPLRNIEQSRWETASETGPYETFRELPLKS